MYENVYLVHGCQISGTSTLGALMYVSTTVYDNKQIDN